MSKKRKWQITLNQVDKYKKIIKYLKSFKSLTYYVSCEEIAPTTKKKHVHIFAYFKNSIKLDVKKCCNAHIEMCNGTVMENINYIKKLKNPEDKILEEYGDIPIEKEKEKLTINKAKEMSNSERLELPLIYYNIVKKIEVEDVNEIDINDFRKDVKVIYIFGDSGIGKTLLATKIIKYLIDTHEEDKSFKKFNSVKFVNNFWIGVGKSSIALYDDFRDFHMKASEFINFIDYSKHTMNVKYGSEKNEYKYIIITSIQDPKYLYGYEFGLSEQKEQWLRRMKIIELKNKEDYKLINISSILN